MQSTPGPIDNSFMAAPALVVGVRAAHWLSPDGEIEVLSFRAAAERLAGGAKPLLCHRPRIGEILRAKSINGFDILELFAFTRPATFALPTVRGIAAALDLPAPAGPDHEAATLFQIAASLLHELAEKHRGTMPMVWAMAGAGWSWGQPILAAMAAGEAPHSRNMETAFQVWRRLPEWEERPRETPPGNLPVPAADARTRLGMLLGRTAERRPQQQRYAELCSAAFLPRDEQGHPNIVLAEAGTGVGKTLGYVASASLWAERNEAPVWISTFTRNLQRQLDTELDRLYPDPTEKHDRIVVRKGRENYLCLLNVEEALGRARTRNTDLVALGLVVRWADASRDGDMGGDFPSWLAHLFGRDLTTELTDTRGECIYSACPHYGKCFIEHTQRRARRADIVIANHALVLIQAALGGGEEGRPLRYVFDEGHHIFQAADAAFSAHLSAAETADLRRWLIGAEGGGRSRSRGLKVRIEDLILGDGVAEKALDDALHAARALPGLSWGQRLADGRPDGATERFLILVRQQVYARAPETDVGYDLEAETNPMIDGLADAADKLATALTRLAAPIAVLVSRLKALLDSDAAELETATRVKIEAVAASLERRAVAQIAAWRSMLDALRGETPPEFVDWFGVSRGFGRDVDVGFNRHWLDPTVPFAEHVLEPAHGAVITSATLRDSTGDIDIDWDSAEIRTGTRHLAERPTLVAERSPFDHPGRTRVIVVTDVGKGDMDSQAAAYRELFLAAGGGGLGIFTAISRLRAVASRIKVPLEDAGIQLLTQHVDPLDTATLVDIFRAEEDACLLGTDAVRDGVDVPGRSLRLIVFDRVPWPRPDILHKARRAAMGGKSYDEMLTRLKIKQAYGRLLRRASDKGVFVMLDRGMPSRLAGAFPDGVEVHRLGLKDAIGLVRAFLAET